MPAKRNETALITENAPITFQLNNTVRIHGTNISELNCRPQSSLARKSCANITEVTCEEERPGKVKLCVVTNENSIFFNSSLVSKTLVCNDANQTKTNCYLIFSPDLLKSRKSADQAKDGQFESNLLLFSSYDPDSDERQRQLERYNSRTQVIVLISMAVFFSIVIGIPVLFCCLVIVNNTCLNGRFNLPLEQQFRGTCFSLQARDEYPDGVTITTTTYR